MRLVVVESPCAGDVAENERYLRCCLADSLSRGEAPFAGHAIYTLPGVLRDDVPEERQRGIAAGFAWAARADSVAVYVDRGISHGMRIGIERAEAAGQLVEYRSLSDY